MLTTQNQPTPQRHFEMRVLCPSIVAASAILDAQARAKKTISQPDQVWFINQAETWVRWLHGNDPKWRKKLDRESNADRDFLVRFVSHWAESFVTSPSTYKRRHPIVAQ
jgi:hypothetical protein